MHLCGIRSKKRIKKPEYADKCSLISRFRVISAYRAIDQNRLRAATKDEPIISIAKTMHSTLIQNCFRSFCFCVDISFLPFLPFLNAAPVYACCAS